MSNTLKGKKVAILATDGYEQVELDRPKEALLNAGALVHVVSLKSGKIQGFNHFEKGDTVNVDLTIEAVKETDYDALMLPGGVHNPDTLRTNKDAVAFVRAFFTAGKPVAAICHAPWVLVEANVVSGRTLTSWPSLRTDIGNAGGTWLDKSVVVDNGLVTSRKPDDLDDFCAKMLEEIGEGRHARQTA